MNDGKRAYQRRLIGILFLCSWLGVIKTLQAWSFAKIQFMRASELTNLQRQRRDQPS